MKIENSIMKYRKELKMSQEQLAECVGVTKSSVSKWETGRTVPDVDVLLKLSKLYGITINQILESEAVQIQSLEEIKGLNRQHVIDVISGFSKEELAKAVMGTSPEIYEYIRLLFPQIELEEEIHKTGRIQVKELEEIHKRFVFQLNQKEQ